MLLLFCNIHMEETMNKTNIPEKLENIYDCFKWMKEQTDKKLKQYPDEKKEGLYEKKLWKNNFINKQIKRRENETKEITAKSENSRIEEFQMEDHIRAMVYAVCSGNKPWKCTLERTDLDSGRIGDAEEIVKNFMYFLENKISKEKVISNLEANIKFRYIEVCKFVENIIYNMEILKEKSFLGNTERTNLQEINYQIRIFDEKLNLGNSETKEIKRCIRELAEGKKCKLKGMGIPLVCEYLRNLGCDIPKPDVHMRNILGKKYIGLLDKDMVSQMKSFDMVMDLAAILKESRRYKEKGECNELDINPAGLDYLLWAYCATGYGEFKSIENEKVKSIIQKEYNKYMEK